MKKSQLITSILIVLVLGIYSGNAQSKLTNDKSINSLIEKKREFNKRNKIGYRIQLYNGLERTAKSIRGRFRVEYPNISTKLSYESPEWKIQVGNYKTRLDADRALNKIREKFSGAIVVRL
ncbi:SPOR domain-containing protein [uncultured Tenacibaculum sp.]|uniref:SPOR domain-containing protein n=1 Tax=uncultured Tenacibaculum sp. TaxID=174713 RepID=UPI0026062277|nr:SPOR domain-containing protein [uncultured Tenacibaculum sp.]